MAIAQRDYDTDNRDSTRTDLVLRVHVDPVDLFENMLGNNFDEGSNIVPYTPDKVQEIWKLWKELKKLVTYEE